MDNVLINQIISYFGDMPYEKGLSLMHEDLAHMKDIDLYIEIFREILTNDKKAGTFLAQLDIRHLNLPRQLKGISIVGNERYTVFLEKLYFDLFHENEKFDPTLIKYLDENGGLKEEFTIKH